MKHANGTEAVFIPHPPRLLRWQCPFCIGLLREASEPGSLQCENIECRAIVPVEWREL